MTKRADDRGKKYHKAYRKKYMQVYYKNNLHKFRENNLKRKYNVDLEEYNQIFAEQQGKCLICGVHQSKLDIPLSVDHCHKTGKVRGLLCINCNRALGLLKDDIENLKCAILYLNKSLGVKTKSGK